MNGTLERVRFYRDSAPYTVGEVAGFTPRQAHRLVVGGVAVFVNPPPGALEDGTPLEAHAADCDPAPCEAWFHLKAEGTSFNGPTFAGE